MAVAPTARAPTLQIRVVVSAAGHEERGSHRHVVLLSMAATLSALHCRPGFRRFCHGKRMMATARSRVRRRAEGRGGMTGLSLQMKEQRKRLEASMAEDEELQLMMQGLRGQNINDSDQQVAGLEMRLVDIPTDEDTGLPLRYDAEELQKYFDRLPWVQLQRVWQIATTGFPLIAGIISDSLTGRSGPDAQVQRAAQFNEIVTMLGPFFIKLGQALSIRPDLLSPRAMVELQKLCDKVPSYPSEIAMATLEKELSEKFGQPTTKDAVFSSMTAEPVAAASLGQVYRATLREPAGVEVAVKVQRPAVLETVSLDLYLIRKLAMVTKYLQELGARDSRRTDFVGLLDEFAARIYEEMDYNKECENGLQVEKDMRGLERVKVPKNYAQYCCRKVHVAEWIEGEKLSQSGATDIRELVNVGVVAYLTQLLDKGLFHADPHPGNMLRTPDGRLAILDFGLMAQITDDQRYGMVEAIAHLVHRDYAEIGTDFRNLDFIPEGVDVKPIVPALSRVFDTALAGGGAKGINFNELSADLAQITFEFPFRIPPYFALIIRAIGVLEGIALVGDPDFAIIDEAYPYLSKQLLTDPSDRLRAALRYMVYGKEGVFDAERLIDLLRALEAFRVTERAPDPEALAAKAAAFKNGRATPSVGLVQDMEQTDIKIRRQQMSERRVGDRPSSWATASSESSKQDGAREALTFLLSREGAFFREFLVEETVKGIDCLGRGGLQALGKRLVAVSPLRLLPGIGPALMESPLGPFGDLFAPPLTAEEEKVVENTSKLLSFLLGENDRAALSSGGVSAETARSLGSAVQLLREDPELARGAREFAQKLANRAFELVSSRALRRLANRVGEPERRLAPA
eukprot:TRINITY_DN27276_c0_g1_i1.p1 TRINITY_DN27276_c0_g1~~TRINITY_DN27276_c0_g1_i1.p1  ORF type:complete len:869 (+),score=177.22 TRINITY_DN27276_c0_g1_i1:38-2608(+)